MYEHEIRWFVLAPTAVLIGLAALFLEACGLWFRFPTRPDFLWCLAVFTVLKAPPAQAVYAFALCGLTRDFLLGPKPGAALLAYLFVGFLVIHWKPYAAVRGLPGQLFLAGAGGLLVALLKHSLDYGTATYKLWYWVLFVSVTDAGLTFVAYPILSLALGLAAFRPWRERSVFIH